MVCTVLANGKAPTTDRDMFLGLLFPSDEHRLYGYVTSTNIKFVLVVGDPNIADRKIREIFKTLHDYYIKLVCNPFYTAGAAIESRRFDTAVASLMVCCWYVIVTDFCVLMDVFCSFFLDVDMGDGLC